MAKYEIPKDAWDDIPETDLPANVAKAKKAADEAYQAHKAAQAEYFEKIRAAQVAQGNVPDGMAMVITRSSWGKLRGALVPEEAATVRSATKAKSKFTLKKS